MALTIISASMLLILLAIGWIMPSLTQPTIPFGVRVPPDRVGDPQIGRARRGYRALLLASFVVIVVAMVAITAAGWVWLGQGVALVGVVVMVAAYYRAHHRLHEIKAREGWYAGQREAVVARVGAPPRPARFPVIWLLPALGVLAVTAVIGVLRYPKLPARIPTHFDLNGTPNGYMTKASGAFLLVGMQVALTLLFAALTWFTLRLRYDVDPADPQASVERQRIFRLRWSRALLVFGALTNLSMFFGSLEIWLILPSNRPITFIVMLAPTALILVGALGLAVMTGQGGSRVRVAGSTTTTGYVHRDDDRFWKGGMLYFNPDDPSLLVEKRFGVGWTINFARPTAWVVLGAVVLLIVGSALLPTLIR